MTGTVFPAFLQLRHDPDQRGTADFLRAVDSTLDTAERRFGKFSAEAQRMIDRVLSRPMTARGSLDLGVAELQRQAAALQQQAIAARELATATELAAKESGDFSQTARLQVAAMQAAAVEAEQAAASARAYASAQEQVQAQLNRIASSVDETALATKRGGIANDNAAASTNALRFGMMDLGRQLSDVSTMWALGARPMQIFASQSGQIIQSVQLMTAGTSRLAGFLGGPWGIALTTSALALTPLIGKLFETADAADEARTALEKLSEARRRDLAEQRILLNANEELNKLLRRQAELEAEIQRKSRGRTQGPQNIPMFAFAEWQELQEVNQKILQGRGGIEFELRRLAGDRGGPITSALAALSDAGRDRGRDRTGAGGGGAPARQISETERFIESLEREIAAIGRTQSELRQLEIARAMEAATTAEQRDRIDELNQAREEALSTLARNEAMERDEKARAALDARIGSIEHEIQILGIVGPAREKAALLFEEEAFKAQAVTEGILDVEAAWQRYLDVRTRQIDAETALDRDAAAAAILAREIDGMVSGLGRIGRAGGILGGLLGLASGNVNSIGGPIGFLLQTVIGTTLDDNGEVIARTLGDELRDVFGLTGVFGQTMTRALQGAGLGAVAGNAAFGNMHALGQAGSALGGALGQSLGSSLTKGLGGAIGSLRGPVGSILGGLAGGLLGSLFGGTKRGSALIGSSVGGLGIFGYHGNSSSRESAAGTLAGSVIEAVNRIAEQLGASVNASVGRVSIGIRDDNYRVDRTGQGITKTKNGAIDFGQDAEAAIAFAVRDLINDGVITGLRQSTLRLLKAGNDIERAVQDALDFESVFKRLRRRKDPTGAALDELDAEFGRLKDLFTRAGASTAEWADLEELYWLERDEIIKEAMDRSLSAMRGSLDELTIGNTALSLRDRRQSAITAYDPLAARVAAGDSSAYDDFVEASRALLDIERELFGSQSGYFERLEQVTNLTRGALNNGLPDFSDRDGPFGRHDYYNRDADIVAGISGTNTLLESQSARLDAVNENLGTIAALLARRGFGGALLASGAGW